jgi:hypothetical protein
MTGPDYEVAVGERITRPPASMGDEAIRRGFTELFNEPEMQAVLAACRNALETSDLHSRDHTAGTPFDESRFFNHSADHRLELVVHEFLVRPQAADFSPATRSAFAEAARSHVMLPMNLVAATLKVHATLKDAGLRHVFLKGPVLAEQLFGRRLLRTCKDVDVLVSRRDLRRAHQALKTAGFHPAVSNWRAALRLPLTASFQKDALYLGPRGENLELHWRTDVAECLVDDLAAIPPATASLQGHDLPVLPDALNCVYLCHHAAKHGWNRLRWLLDIPLFLKARGLNEESVLLAASANGTDLVVREALHLAHALLGTGQQRKFLNPQEEIRMMRRFLKVTQGIGPVNKVRSTWEQRHLYPGLRHKLTFFGIVLLNSLLPLLGYKPRSVVLSRSPR